jgi:AraC-like DNA-binding protein
MNAPAEGRLMSGGTTPAGRRADAMNLHAMLGARNLDADSLAPKVADFPRIVGSILVGHSSPLVEMGLLSILSRSTVHGVATLHELKTLPRDEMEKRHIDIVVADRALADELVRFAAGLGEKARNGVPKILLIGAGPASSHLPPGAAASYDACLPLECRRSDLLDAVNLLILSGMRDASMRSARVTAPAVPAASPARAPGMYDAAPAGTHRIEGFALHANHSQVPARPRGGLAPGALRRVRDAVAQRLDDKLDLSQLAGVAGLSRSHFARAFKESVGQPPHRYLMEKRVAAAADLVKDTDRKLADIAVELGFFDHSHFVRVFTRILGETPSAYRRRHR